MSRIEELIEKLCPNGVEYKTLGELGKFYGGITGKSKEDFKNGNAKFITYKNVYDNISLKLDVEDRVRIGETENQRTLEYGDIIFTGSSETPDECGISSVLTEKTDEKLYLNSFCFFFRFNDKEIMNPEFAKHLFRSSDLRYQIGKTASGVTRYNVSKKLMEGVCIPVPPLEVQCEIVHVLDDFTLLSAELSAELKDRQKQYEYYRNKLFEDVKDKSKIMMVQELSNNISSGGTPLTTNQSFYKGDIPWLRTQEVNFDEIWDTEIKITEEAIAKSSAKIIPENCVIVAMYGATVGKVAINKIKLSTNQACCNIEVNQNIIDYKYLFYWLSEQYQYIKSLGQGSQTNINAKIVKELKVPVPSLDEQKKIVNILSKFQKITQDISEGLPAEIEARQKQYNYYRDKLLNFKKMED